MTFFVGRLHVFLQLMRPKEAFLTNLTSVAVISSVDAHVVIQVIPSCIPLVTLIALEWLVLRVCEQMTLKLVLAVECLHASSVASKRACECGPCIRVMD